MRHLFITVLTVSLLAANCLLASARDQITLTFPAGVIASAAKAVLPLKVDAHSKSIVGDITIIDIRDLALTEGHLACRLKLAGNNLALVTELAGHEIKLKVGALEVEFATVAEIRFDAKQQVLYIKPVIKDLATGSNAAAGDIGQALVALLNGREFPVKIDKLQPIIAEAGMKTITIRSTIGNIAALQDAVQLTLVPQISAR